MVKNIGNGNRVMTVLMTRVLKLKIQTGLQHHMQKLKMYIMPYMKLAHSFYRSNFMGTHFTVFDNGESPKSRGAQDPNRIRQELAASVYVSVSISHLSPLLCFCIADLTCWEPISLFLITESVPLLVVGVLSLWLSGESFLRLFM